MPRVRSAAAVAAHERHGRFRPVAAILISGHGSITRDDESLRMIVCILTPEIYPAETSAGWYYREPAPGGYARWKPIDAYPMQGPFSTAEEAARHAAATLDRSRFRGEWDALAKLEGAGGDAARALMVATNL